MGRTLANIYNLPLVALVLAHSEEAAESETTTVRHYLSSANRPADLIQVHPVTANRIGGALQALSPGIIIFDRRDKLAPEIEEALDAVNSSVLSLG